jgi:hypothetical protein
VFYQWESKSHEYGLNYDGQAADIGGLATTRELLADSFRHFHDAVDGGISFLLFVDPVRGRVCSDDAGGAYTAGAGVGIFTTEFTEGTDGG